MFAAMLIFMILFGLLFSVLFFGALVFERLGCLVVTVLLFI